MLERISAKFNDIVRQVSGKSTISTKNIQDAVEEIKIALLEADVNLRVVRRFVNRTIKEATGEEVLRSVNPGQMFTKLLHDRMVGLLGDARQELALKGPDTLSVILMMGLQGSGKTTTSAKLAAKLKKEGRRPLLVAADLMRPAAIRQLQILGAQIGVEVYAEEDGNSVKVVKNALRRAEKGSFNTMIIDTAGRLHLDEAMMADIKAVHKAADPCETLFVADAMTGQNAVEIAEEFDSQVGIGGVILTKFDSDTRGGAALSLKSVTGRCIKYIGTGEKITDLEIFYPERIASRILGMGDVVSLVEKAQETFEAQDAQILEKKIASATFTLQDYLDQFARVKKMGNLKSMVEMIPGMSDRATEDAFDEKEMKKEEAIIFSMTRMERGNHRIIGPSRRKRIAKGSGVNVYDVNRLIKKFEKTRLMMKKVVKNKKYQQKVMSQLGG